MMRVAYSQLQPEAEQPDVDTLQRHRVLASLAMRAAPSAFNAQSYFGYNNRAPVGNMMDESYQAAIGGGYFR